MPHFYSKRLFSAHFHIKSKRSHTINLLFHSSIPYRIDTRPAESNFRIKAIVLPSNVLLPDFHEAILYRCYIIQLF